MSEAPLLAIALVAWGSHAAAPLAVRDDLPARTRWRWLALPLGGAAALALALTLATDPDRALAAGLGPLPIGTPRTGFLSFALFLLLATDSLVAAGGEKLGRKGFTLAGIVGLVALVPSSWIYELLRAGEGPTGSLPWLIAATVARILLALAAGELLAPGRPRWAALAPIAIPLSFFSLPAAVRSILVAGGDPATYLAAAVLLTASRWLPERFRKVALGAGVVLTAIALARAATASAALAGTEIIPLPPGL